MHPRADLCDVAVVVPVFNEGSVIGEVLRELLAVFPQVVCVDDGSRDQTAAVVKDSGASLIRHAVNLGQGAALQTGFDYVLSMTKATHVVTFDGDGQHRASDAMTMVDLARTRSLDIVLGSRRLGATVDQPWQRKLLLRAALRLSRTMTRLDLTDTHNGLRVLSRHALENIRLTQTGMAYASELEMLIARRELTWVEAPICVTYSDYSMSKGQGNLNSVNIVFDLASAAMRGAW